MPNISLKVMFKLYHAIPHSVFPSINYSPIICAHCLGVYNVFQSANDVSMHYELYFEEPLSPVNIVYIYFSIVRVRKTEIVHSSLDLQEIKRLK